MVNLPTNNPRPRLWVKWFINPFVHKKGKGAIIRRRKSRIDVFPWNQFSIGNNTIIEDFTTINNGAGNIIIGNNARVGIGSVIIGPVYLGNKVGLGQHVFISGFNHGYEDGERDSNEQALVKKKLSLMMSPISGPTLSSLQEFISVKDAKLEQEALLPKIFPIIPVAVGNPAKIIKRYNFQNKTWERTQELVPLVNNNSNHI